MGGGKKRQKESKKKTKANIESSDAFQSDERFAHALKRPQFRKTKHDDTKIVLDERFASVLTDERFQLHSKDKYGRRREKKKGLKSNELEAFYTVKNSDKLDQIGGLERDERKPDDHDDDESKNESSRKQKETDEEEEEEPASRIAYLTALSRGELEVSSSSDEETSSHESSDGDSEGEDEDAVHGRAGVLDPSTKEKEDETPITYVPSPYMAVMNMDWTHCRAVDLLMILSSFTSPGAVKSVRVYLSDYGKERMEKEKREGPSGLWKKGNDGKKKPMLSTDSNHDREKGNEEDECDRSDDLDDDHDPSGLHGAQEVDSGFDPEKLRAYEASKLKYYFAVVTFASPHDADVAYKEVDGLEFEHSSAAMDMRSIDPDVLAVTVHGRELRDEASSVPSRYEPPDFVVSALQQTSVECTWEDGDRERERKLTGYARGQTSGWGEATEDDDLRAYLASDNSSDSSDEDDGGGERNHKGSHLRKMLGLDDGDTGSGSDDEMPGSAEQEIDDDEPSNDDVDKTVTFVPGKKNLEQKIRSKLGRKEDKELTPWEKYQQKRKQKKRERRQAARARMKETQEESDRASGHMAIEGIGGLREDDDFFTEESNESAVGRKHNSRKSLEEAEETERKPSSKAELELIMAGDNEEEELKDYDMRGLVRMEKNKNKKLRGLRKRKEAEVAAQTSGTAFKVDVKDERFSAVLEGTDDRFVIDKTDPNFKETEAMHAILSQQEEARKSRKRSKVTKDVDANSPTIGGGGAAALSALVMNLKAKVSRKTGQ